MRVEATLRRSPAARVGAPAGANKSAHGFSIVVDNDAAPAAATHESAAADGIGALLALQVVGDPLSSRKRAVQNGRDVLDVLDRIKVALLEGRVPLERLERLGAIVAERASSGDERLDQLLAEIDLRARVELAKLGR
jgi:hypothetical protein